MSAPADCQVDLARVRSYRLTCEINIAIDGYFKGRKNWTDGVHSKLKKVLVGLVVIATAPRNRAQKCEERKQW